MGLDDDEHLIATRQLFARRHLAVRHFILPLQARDNNHSVMQLLASQKRYITVEHLAWWKLTSF